MHLSFIDAGAAECAADAGQHSYTTRCSAAAIYLISKYTQTPCPLLAHAIAQQLQMLARLPATAANAALRALALGLLPHWQSAACRHQRAPVH
jgi:hypothetical protein